MTRTSISCLMQTSGLRCHTGGEEVINREVCCTSQFLPDKQSNSSTSPVGSVLRRGRVGSHSLCGVGLDAPPSAFDARLSSRADSTSPAVLSSCRAAADEVIRAAASSVDDRLLCAVMSVRPCWAARERRCGDGGSCESARGARQGAARGGSHVDDS
jgi:hypothetical protein